MLYTRDLRRDVETLLRALDGTRAPGDSPWVYDASVHTYRDTRTGKFMAGSERLALRDEVAARQRDRLLATTETLTNGDLTASQYQQQIAAQLRSIHTQQYAFGRGGIHAMTDADRAAVKAAVDKQQEYLHKFSVAIDEGNLSEAQIRARASLYANAARASFEHGRAASFGDLNLPQYPGDGQTECRVNCRCHLEIVEKRTTWEVRWIVDVGAEHCDDCTALASSWSPKVIQRP